MNDDALIIFVKNLIAGRVKTRLAATMGNDAAMDIYKQLLLNTHNIIRSFEADKFVFYSDFMEDDIWKNDLFQKKLQGGNDLGERMENAFKNLFTIDYKKSIIIGTDCPEINGNILKNAFKKLDDFDVVIGPATDGGYYLLGIKKEHPFLFRDIKWSTNEVMNQTIELCKRNQLSYFLLPELSDIDEEKDLKHLKNLFPLKQHIS
ncbi:MAG: TIGR04282 family arsenosugar biosynthesis glycosyltransferase [Ginsengibacter sp.]